MSSSLKRTVAVVACATLFGGYGVSSALAGEITGGGDSLKYVPAGGGAPRLHGRSECAFSGLNDDYVLGDTTASHTQTPKGARQFVGYACNPSGARG